MINDVIDVIRQVSGVSDIQPGQDFYDAGVASVQALPLLMELETKFDVMIPDDRFITARTPVALSDLITSLQKGS